MGEGVQTIAANEDGSLEALDAQGEAVFRWDAQAGIWESVERGAVWTYTAQEAQFGGVETYNVVMEWLSHPENIPTNEDIVRIITSEGEELPFGQVMLEKVTHNSETRAFVLGGIVETGWGIDPTYAVILLEPIDPDDMSKGGRVVTMNLFDTYSEVASFPMAFLSDGDFIDNTYRWEYTHDIEVYQDGLIKIFREGLKPGGDLWGRQVAVAINFPARGSYDTSSGYISGSDVDANDDGVAESGAYLVFRGATPIVISAEGLSPEFVAFLESLDLTPECGYCKTGS